jgi:hypothetical protein
MSRRPAGVTQTEVENAVRGVQAAGVRVAEVRILPDGTIVIMSDCGSVGATVPWSIVDALFDDAEREMMRSASSSPTATRRGCG